MLRFASLYAGPRICNMEIRNIPVLDQTAEFRDDTKLPELTQSLDCQHALIIKLIFAPLLRRPFAAISLFIGDRCAATARKIYELPWLAILSAPKFENLSLDHGTGVF